MEPQCLPRASASPLCPVPGLFYQPWPRTGLGESLAPGPSLPTLKVCPDCQPHIDLPQGSGGTAICPRRCPSELISCLPLAGASGPHVRWVQEEAPDGLVEERVGLELGLNSNLAPRGLLRSLRAERDSLVSRTSIYKLRP